LKELLLYQNHSPVCGIVIKDSRDQKVLLPRWGIEPNPVSRVHLMAEGETLCDKDWFARGKGLEDLPRVPFGETNRLQMEEDLSIHSSNQRGLVSIFDFQGPEGVYGFNAWKGRKFPWYFEWKKGRVARQGIRTREDEGIPIDRLFYPEIDGLPEAQDHDGDADEHGEGSHQGGDRDHRPRHGVLDITAR